MTCFPRISSALLLIVITLVAAGSAATGEVQAPSAPELPGYLHFTPAELESTQRELVPRMNALKQAAEQVGDYGNSTAWIAHREADGLMEIHEDWTDLMFVHSGEATLLLGGRIPNARTDAPGEIRGDTAIGGVRRRISAGDVVRVPAGMPHQFLVADGQQITFFTMKIAR